jgi:hypothetical protein
VHNLPIKLRQKLLDEKSFCFLSKLVQHYKMMPLVLLG